MTGLAIIMPLETIDKESVYSELFFLQTREIVKTFIPNNVFKYYFYGVTLEVVELDKNNNCISIHDVKKDDLIKYNLSINYALTISFDEDKIASLSTNGFVYYLEQTTFFKRYNFVLTNMYNAMKSSNNFVVRFFIINGAISYVQLECNKPSTASDYKYALHNGFSVSNRDILKCMLPKTDMDFIDSKEKLNQEAIDKLFEQMNVQNIHHQ